MHRRRWGSCRVQMFTDALVILCVSVHSKKYGEGVWLAPEGVFHENDELTFFINEEKKSATEPS